MSSSLIFNPQFLQIYVFLDKCYVSEAQTVSLEKIDALY